MLDDDGLGSGDPEQSARRLLGAEVTAGGVTVRVVEVEAYGGDVTGPWPDPASHSYRGPTTRNSIMFGPAGRLYVYLSYGIHLCMNVACGPDGVASAVLLRSGEVVDGLSVARSRRPRILRPELLGTGPGNLGKILGISLQDNGTDLFDALSSTTVRLASSVGPVSCGPRVGVSVAAERPWRFWLPDSPSVSVYRRSPRAPVITGTSGSVALPAAGTGGLTGE